MSDFIRIPETSYHYDIVPGDFVQLGWRDRTTNRSYSKICFNELRMIINCIINFIFDKTIDNFGCMNEI